MNSVISACSEDVGRGRRDPCAHVRESCVGAPATTGSARRRWGSARRSETPSGPRRRPAGSWRGPDRALELRAVDDDARQLLGAVVEIDRVAGAAWMRPRVEQQDVRASHVVSSGMFRTSAWMVTSGGFMPDAVSACLISARSGTSPGTSRGRRRWSGRGVRDVAPRLDVRVERRPIDGTVGDLHQHGGCLPARCEKKGLPRWRRRRPAPPPPKRGRNRRLGLGSRRRGRGARGSTRCACRPSRRACSRRAHPSRARTR